MTVPQLNRILAAACAVIALAASLAAPPGQAAAAKWTQRQLPPVQSSEGESIPIGLSGVSCPTESLCVAVGGRQGTLAFSQKPTGGAESWRWTRLEYPVGPGETCTAGDPDCEAPSGALQAVSCASEGLCALVTYDGWIFVSTNPAAGSGAWTGSNVNGKGQQGATHLISISCPSPSFCAAVSGGSYSPNAGKVLTSTDPTAGDWQVADLGAQLDLRSISCGTPSFCIAAGRGGRLFTSTDPGGGASAWRPAPNPGGAGDLEGASCVSTVLCAVGNMTGNILTSTDPADAAAATWNATKAGGSVQITGVSCPDAGHCLAVDDNGDVLTSTGPTGGPGSWHLENLLPFTSEGQPHNALFGASCASTSLCALVGRDGRIFTSTDPFSASSGGAGHHGARRALKRPRTILVFAERFWWASRTRHRHVRARFHFYSPTRTRGFECKRDHGPYRRCHSPLRYWVGHGRHVLRVRAIGPTGLRGPAAIKRFRVTHRRSR